jgi:predicted DNA-binding protein YlxM (UPF0122 family)
MKEQRIVFRVSSELMEDLTERAYNEGLSLSEIVRKACVTYLNAPDIITEMEHRLKNIEETLKIVSGGK